MNESQENATSRREFLKKTGGAAALAASAGLLADGCETTNPVDPPSANNSKKTMARAAGDPNPNESNTHEKLGKIGPPVPGLPPYDLDRRMPHWAPDRLVGSDPAKTKILYPEEPLVGPNPADSTNTNTLFVPEQPPLQDEAKFRSWVFGSKLKEPATSLFDIWLVELCKQIRLYNRALYRLRKMRLDIENKTTDRQYKMDELPNDEISNVDPGKAQDDWKRRVNELQKHLDSKQHSDPMDTYYKLMPVVVDMIEVNGYIVSVRAVAKVLPVTLQVAGRVRISEIGGSESSHISVSSAFSSP